MTVFLSKEKNMAQKKLLLIDGNSVAFRAFYALYRQLDRFTSPDGLHTNAIFTRSEEHTSELQSRE